MRSPVALAGYREMLVLSLVLGSAIAVGGAAAASGHLWGLPLAVLGVIAWAGGIAFFRDPERQVPANEGVMVAPADGKVTHTDELDDHPELGGPARRVSIFLSVFDVHVNRSPCSGTVRKVQYHPGRFLDAREEDSGHLNEANLIVIEADEPGVGPVVVRQVAGKVARRIVCSVEPGDRVEIGQRIGLIKFGSRTDLIVRADSGYVAAVGVGDRTRGAATVIARRTGKDQEGAAG